MACNGLQDCSKVQVTEFPFHKTGKDFGKSKIIPWGGNKKTAQSSISNSRPFVSFSLHWHIYYTVCEFLFGLSMKLFSDSD